MECIFHRYGSHHLFWYHIEKDKDVLGRSCTICYGTSCLPLANCRQCTSQHVGAWLVLHQEGWYHHFTVYHRTLVPDEFWLG